MKLLGWLFNSEVKKELKVIKKELDSVKNEIIKITDQDVIDSLYSLGESDAIDSKQEHK